MQVITAKKQKQKTTNKFITLMCHLKSHDDFLHVSSDFLHHDDYTQFKLFEVRCYI